MGEHRQAPDLFQPSLKLDKDNSAPASQPEHDQPNRERRAVNGPEIYDIEDLPPGIQEASFGSEAVKPYDIEEPGEESTSEPELSSLPQHIQRRYWEELVSSMEDLYCDSDNSSPGSISSKRGRKRKPPALTILPQAAQPEKSASVSDAQYASPNLSPKRPRKRDKRPRDRPLNPAQKIRIQRPRGFSGSSYTSVSTDTEASGTNLTNGFSTPDAMDLD
ncbi:uncharacterized protein DSM5745_03392 [Aspergillus mulundensis]|uniref:Uncharacterized protein n=1 Tax=Aspergillus mulundensis TaxID=1810919 RepID=A0A3D8SK95_9EURO|nr:hypothetical protein DSM5745_03392 [Aspergillus mulundensis]RDW86750.1 hypothetical protein DSM5745_03392 [Aspergillus mulundensis]